MHTASQELWRWLKGASSYGDSMVEIDQGEFAERVNISATFLPFLTSTHHVAE